MTVGAGGLYVITPGVDDAPRRVASILATHDATGVDVSRDAKVARAVVATEDHRFYQDYGIDPISVARAATGTVGGSTTDQGGATIAQQLAKGLYTPTNNDLLAKVEQVALAVKLDGHYTKDQILSMYLNAIYYGNGYWGVDPPAATSIDVSTSSPGPKRPSSPASPKPRPPMTRSPTPAQPGNAAAKSSPGWRPPANSMPPRPPPSLAPRYWAETEPVRVLAG